MINFPYTNFHQLNLDWLVKAVKKLVEDVKKIPTRTSQLINDSGYITEAQAASVRSVNGKTGVVTLTAADVGAKPASYAAPVDSVNGQTGAVNLTAADVGAKPASYAAPVDSVNGQTGTVSLDYRDVGALENFVSVNGVSSIVTAAQARPSQPFIFNGTANAATALAGASGTCFGIAKLNTGSTRLDYVIFVPGIARTCTGYVNTDTSAVTYTRLQNVT